MIEINIKSVPNITI